METMTTEQRTRFVLSPTSDFRYGACVHKPLRGGWIFVPNVNNRRPSRRVFATPEAAVPRWAKPYRFQEILTVGTREARDFPLTYRPGEGL